MERFSGNYIDCYEKVISVRQIYQMYRERKIAFPKVPLMRRHKKIEHISEIIEIILLGFALPTVYVSERQAKVLGYLYNVVWICQEKECEVQWGLERVIDDRMLWRDIESGKANIANIRTHFKMIEERLW